MSRNIAYMEKFLKKSKSKNGDHRGKDVYTGLNYGDTIKFNVLKPGISRIF